jgi:predicted hotdog family 3-hydroxylacyl-ACP dehydratase
LKTALACLLPSSSCIGLPCSCSIRWSNAPECAWRVNPDDSFVEPEIGVPVYVGVEFMAQCVAVHAGARARVEGLGPPLGFLLGTRHFKASITHFEVGETYRATCEELIRDTNGMGSYECSIVHGDTMVAQARLAVLEKERGKKLQ